MAKSTNEKKSPDKQATDTKKKDRRSPRLFGPPDGYSYAMSHASYEEPHWFQLLPAAFFTAVIVLIVRMHVYERPMDQFFWSTGETQQTDFFSYFKMVFILICATLALIMILYRVMTQSLTIKRCFAYIPMGVYSLFVLLSYMGSEYKDFALLGWVDRFEGTLPLLAYMVMLFFIINTVNSERSVKWIVYPLGITSGLLSILGVTQALDHDFFQTTIGKKLITPSWYWPNVDSLQFNFTNKEIYQTVYNINYVSFYLTLLIPLFGMIFIHSVNAGKDEPLWKKLGWGVLFALLIFNLIGSASSGGYLGLAAIILLGVILLNKRLLQWWKPLAVLLVLSIAVVGVTYERWLPEVSGAIHGVLGTESTQEAKSGDSTVVAEADAVVKPHIDYFETGKDSITMSIDGNPFTVTVGTDDQGDADSIQVKDGDGTLIPMDYLPQAGLFTLNDDRFLDYVTMGTTQSEGVDYLVINTTDMQWPFALTEDGVLFRNQLGKLIPLTNVPHMIWDTETNFGNGRGYIWSRTLPMMQDTLFLGNGADTYCAYFPHDDYAGKYSTPAFTSNLNIIVDKPHNMYMGMGVGTGGISLIALLALWVIYILQSARLYFKTHYDNQLLPYIGIGIFLGICGFLVTGLVDDSSVSVMPMFYGLLGTGIAINHILQLQLKKNAAAQEDGK